jgi:histidinol dehydrogenase
VKTVRGLETAKKVLCDARGLNLDSAPPAVLQRTAEALGEDVTLLQAVELILKRVREGGDAALRELASRLDGVDTDTFEVPPSAVADAYRKVPEELVEALELSARRVRRFHEASLPTSWMDFTEGYGETINPVDRVGAYVPGGTARYPSTVLMTAIPAKVAGVGEVIVATPPGEGRFPHPAVLVAADIAGAGRIYQIGGAQAVAAMAYGTETVPKVDMICGPGNIFVTLAKKLLYGEVGIDGLYGPTETVVVADDSANPTLCAADLVAQAEHDVLATPVLITTSVRVAEAVEKELEVRVARIDRAEIARESLEKQGYIVILDDLDEALELANQFAPEHLCLMVKDPWDYVGRVRSAGALFLGEFSHEVLGDYVAGPSHVMPTGGTARFGSGISVRTFLKVSPVVGMDRRSAAALAKAASIIARAEGLTGHAEAAEIRQELRPSG